MRLLEVRFGKINTVDFYTPLSFYECNEETVRYNKYVPIFPRIPVTPNRVHVFYKKKNEIKNDSRVDITREPLKDIAFPVKGMTDT